MNRAPEHIEEELKKFVMDGFVYGIGILEIEEDGKITRIDPYSEEGQKILGERKNEG